MLQSTFVFGWEPLLTLCLLAGVGAFFFGALITDIQRGVKEEGWFGGKQKDDDFL